MIEKIDQLLDLLSKWLLVLCVFLMLFLTLFNITLRWFEISILWIEPLVRHIVFLATFLGGSLATGNNQHIKIDLFAKFLEKRKDKRISILVDQIVTLVTFIAACVLVYSAYLFTLVEFEYGKESFLNIHSGYLVSIIVYGMLLIAMRLFLKFLMGFRRKI